MRLVGRCARWCFRRRIGVKPIRHVQLSKAANAAKEVRLSATELKQSIVLTLETGKFPTDAWMTVEVGVSGVKCLEAYDFTPGRDVDFGPAVQWAQGCSLEGCSLAPEGWRLRTLDERGQVRRYCDA